MTPDELLALAEGDGRGVFRGDRWIGRGVKPDGESAYFAVMAGGDVVALTSREDEARLIALAPSLARDHAALLKWAERAQGFIKQTHAALDGEDLHMMFDLMSDSAALLAEFDVLRERP